MDAPTDAPPQTPIDRALRVLAVEEAAGVLGIDPATLGRRRKKYGRLVDDSVLGRGREKRPLHPATRRSNDLCKMQDAAPRCRPQSSLLGACFPYRATWHCT